MNKLEVSITKESSTEPSKSFKERVRQMGREMFHEEFPQALYNEVLKEKYLANNLVVMYMRKERGDWKYSAILLIFYDGIGLRGKVICTHNTNDHWSYPMESAELEGNTVKIVYGQYNYGECKRKTPCDVDLLSFYPSDNIWLNSRKVLKEYKA